MKQSPSSKLYTCSNCREISIRLCNPEVHCRVQKSPSNEPYSEPYESSPRPRQPVFLVQILILFFHLRLGLVSLGFLPISRSSTGTSSVRCLPDTIRACGYFQVQQLAIVIGPLGGRFPLSRSPYCCSLGQRKQWASLMSLHPS